MMKTKSQMQLFLKLNKVDSVHEKFQNNDPQKFQVKVKGY